jgi:hypothetical protein
MDNPKQKIRINDLVLYVDKYKWFVPILLLVCGIVFLLVYPQRNTSRVSPKKGGETAMSSPAVSLKRSVVLNGHGWTSIDQYEANDFQRNLKSQILKITLESSLLCGKPIITPTQSISDYVKYIDFFYKSVKNNNIPVFFALKIADLDRNKAPLIAINNYRLAIEKKLKETKLIEE